MKIKKSLTIALAYLGVIVGAGFASGKEIEQYYVSFGSQGLWGAVLSTFIYGLTGYIALQMGSFYKAQDHHSVLKNIAPSFISKLFDWILTLTLFLLGLTMIAGGGSNLNQQFGLATWVGSLLAAVIIILAGYFNVEKVTQLIGYLTPLIVVFFIIIPIYSYFTMDLSLAEVNLLSSDLVQTLPNWVVSAFNHVSLNFMLVFSMATVMGGNEEDIRTASIGGGMGGIWTGLLQLLGYLAIFLRIEVAGGTAMPLLALAQDMHPIVGLFMAVTIYIMIISTAIGMFYPLAQRIYNMITPKESFYSRKKFTYILIVCVLLGFLASFSGFEVLVAYVYPVIGYSGFILMGVLLFAWIRKFKDYHTKSENRQQASK